MKTIAIRAVCFDFGQTLAFLSFDFLATRLAERGVRATAGRLEAGYGAARNASEQTLTTTGSAEQAWKAFMIRLIDYGAYGLVEGQAAGLADWLWTEQPHKNLWRAVPAAVFPLLDHLLDRGLFLGVISNSEGHLAALAHELGLATRFRTIADSGVLGFDKPDPRIFAWTLGQLGLRAEEAIHVGDSRIADVEGALRVGLRAIWFDDESPLETPAGAIRARSYAELGAVLSAL